MQIDYVRVANLFQNFNFLRELVELALRCLALLDYFSSYWQAVPRHFNAFFPIDCLPDNLVSTFSKNSVQL